jgi:hypothetical protein
MPMRASPAMGSQTGKLPVILHCYGAKLPTGDVSPGRIPGFVPGLRKKFGPASFFAFRPPQLGLYARSDAVRTCLWPPAVPAKGFTQRRQAFWQPRPAQPDGPFWSLVRSTVSSTLGRRLNRRSTGAWSVRR